MKQYTMPEALALLEITPQEASLLNIQGLQFIQAVKQLEKFKELISKRRKLLSKKYHPDVTKDDGSKMQEINRVVDSLLKLEVIRPRPVPRVVTVRVYNTASTGYWTSSSYSGTSSTTGY